tara:strand:- start:55 stop:675 length:621 start_codon:yes stop_codon:yes gene_type:complete
MSAVTTIVTFIQVKDTRGRVQDRYQNGKRDDVRALDDSSTQEWTDDNTTYIGHPKGHWSKNDKPTKAPYVKRTNNSIELDGKDYYFLPFIYQGAAKNRSGDNLEAALVFANNRVAMNRAREAVINKWTVDVFVCRVDPVTLAPLTTYGNPYLTKDIWLASSLGYDSTTVEVLLSSGIDAVGSNAPNRVLTTGLVGYLPITGSIQNR